MSTYNTGNPIGSVDVKDLYDNAQNLDHLVNDRSVTQYPDRLGNARKSWWGMEQDFNAFLQGSQFEYPPLNYVDGTPLVVLRPTQTIQRSGQLYRVLLPASFPVTLSGTWATDAPLLTAMADTALRQDFNTRLSNLPHIKDPQFNVVADGVADDTVAFLAAVSAARAKNVPLLMSGTVRFVASSVPSGSKHAGNGGDVVSICSLIGYPFAKIQIEGAIGFDTFDIVDTEFYNLEVVTTGMEIPETGSEGQFPIPFQSNGAVAKRSITYSGVRVTHTVSAGDGSVRGPFCVREANSKNITVENCEFSNTVCGLFLVDSENISVRDIYSKNIQTTVYLKNPNRYSVTNVFLTNTQPQSTKWVGRTRTPTPRDKNGLDVLLVENGNRGTVSGIEAEFPIERATYIQSSNIAISDSKVLNGDGFKIVGTSRTNPAYGIKADNLHVSLDSNFVANSTDAFCVRTYFSNNVEISNCTITNNTPGQVGTGILVGGGQPHTTRNVSITNCSANNSGTLVYLEMMSQTAAELAAIDPTQTFVLLDGLSIRNCSIKLHESPLLGALVTMRDLSASADAKATYALKNTVLNSNSIVQGTARARWIFDLRYIDTLSSYNTQVNSNFFLTYPPTITEPNTGVYMEEPYLKQSPSINPTVLFTGMANTRAIANSFVKFTLNSANTMRVSTMKLPATGPFSTATKELELTGYGSYFQTAAAVVASIELDTGTGKYIGRVNGATKTDILGTPPITVTASASNLEIRGDLAPTTRYVAKLTFS